MKSAFIVSTEPFSSRMLLRLLCVYLRQHCVFIDRLFNLSKCYLTGDWMSNKLGRPVEAVKDQEYFMEKPLFTRSDIYRNWSKWNALYFLTKKHHTHTHRNVLLTERHHKRHSFTCRRWIYSARLGSDSLPTIFFRAFHFHWDRLFVFDQLKYSRSLFDISSHRMTQLLIHSVQSEKWHRKQRCRVSSTKLFWHWKIVCCPRIDWRRRHRNKMGSINKWRLICVFWVASWFKWLAFYWNCLRWVNTQQASHLSLLYWFAMVVDESEREHLKNLVYFNLQVAMATGQVLFQRFYYSKSFLRHSMETTAMSCICLASKIEEAPRRIRDVINVFQHIKQVRGQK